MDLGSTKGPGWWNPFVRTLGITAGMFWFCADEQQRLFSFLRSCVSGPASNLGPEAWDSAWSGGLWSGIRNCSALPYSQPVWIRCIKNICGHSKRPPPNPLHEQRAPWDWLLQLVSVTGSSPSLRKQKKVESFRGGTLIANPKCSFDFFFSRIYTFMMYKNGQTVTLCSIAPSESPQFKLSKPQQLQSSSQSVHVDIYTEP